MTAASMRKSVAARRKQPERVEVRYREIATPVGSFVLMEDAAGHLQAHWGEGEWTGAKGEVSLRRDRSLRGELTRKLERYFAGDARVDFGNVATPDGPEFYHACWRACRTIPAGQTWTYVDLAEAGGRLLERGGRAAVRAAGQAMRNNRLPVIVPCHRVVSEGGIGGYGGSMDPDSAGLRIKKWLLGLEGAI